MLSKEQGKQEYGHEHCKGRDMASQLALLCDF